jgi:hypothetical protein
MSYVFIFVFVCRLSKDLNPNKEQRYAFSWCNAEILKYILFSKIMYAMRIESALTINIEAILGSPRLMYLFTWFCFFFLFLHVKFCWLSMDMLGQFVEVEKVMTCPEWWAQSSLCKVRITPIIHDRLWWMCLNLSSHKTQLCTNSSSYAMLAEKYSTQFQIYKSNVTTPSIPKYMYFYFYFFWKYKNK